MDIATRQKRLPALDGFRIVCAFFVFLFHSTPLVDYSFFGPFLSASAIFMDAFFLLSGFSLCCGYADKNLETPEEILSFYKRRIVKLYPAYFVVMSVWFLVHCLVLRQFPLFKSLLIAPVEILLLQSFFPKSEFVVHNTGTWFVSVIALCYFLFPLIKKIAGGIKLKTTFFLMAILYCLCSGMPFFTHAFGIDAMYFNPFFRFLEFSLGVLLGRCFLMTDARASCLKSFFALLFSFAVLFVFVTLYTMKGLPNLWYLQFCFISLPVFCLQIFLLAGLDNEKLHNFFSIKAVKFFTALTYEFFLAQHFCFDITRWLLSENVQKEQGIQYNCIVFVCSFLICLLVSLAIHWGALLVRKIGDSISAAVKGAGLARR